MTPFQFVRWCRSQGYGTDIYEQPYPHYYLTLWLKNRQRAAQSGIIEYPEPEKGELGQDADLMLAFEVLDEFQEQVEQNNAARVAMQQKAAEMWGNTGAPSSPPTQHRSPLPSLRSRR